VRTPYSPIEQAQLKTTGCNGRRGESHCLSRCPSEYLRSPIGIYRLRERTLDLILARLVKLFGEFQFDADLSGEHLFDDSLLVVAGAQSRWAKRRKVDLAELVEEPWILPPGSWNHLAVEEGFRAIGMRMPRICVETFSVALRNQLLLGGRYIAAIPSSMFLAKAKAPGLKVLPVGLPKKPWPVAIVTLKNRTLSPAADLFIENAREIAGLMKARP